MSLAGGAEARAAKGAVGRGLRHRHLEVRLRVVVAGIEPHGVLELDDCAADRGFVANPGGGVDEFEDAEQVRRRRGARAVAGAAHGTLERRLGLGPRRLARRALVAARDSRVSGAKKDERAAELEVVLEPEQAARRVEGKQFVRAAWHRAGGMRDRAGVVGANG